MTVKNLLKDIQESLNYFSCFKKPWILFHSLLCTIQFWVTLIMQGVDMIQSHENCRNPCKSIKNWLMLPEKFCLPP